MVVDEAGRPVPGASVQASWMLTGMNGSSDGSIATNADDRGGFVLEGLGPGSTVSITARHRDRQTQIPLKVLAGEAGPVAVTISPTPVLAVAGRVLGPGGTPLEGIPVKVQFRVPRDNFQGFPEQGQFQGNPQIRTGPDGSYRTPKELERKASEFRVEVVAEGFLPARTAWVPTPSGDLLTLPDLSLKRSRGVRIVSGRVIDRDGKPVAGAAVSQAGDGPRWTFAKADAAGQFRLPGVAVGQALVFAEATGFRFGGTIIGGRAGPVEIRLARVSEPPMTTLKALPSPLPRADERALARQLLEPLLPRARSGELGNAGASVLPALARVDPARVLEMIENRVSGSVIDVAIGQFEDDPASAIATIQDDLDPGSRARGLARPGGIPPCPRSSPTRESPRPRPRGRPLRHERRREGQTSRPDRRPLARAWVDRPGPADPARRTADTGRLAQGQVVLRGRGICRGPGRDRPSRRHRALRAARLDECLADRSSVDPTATRQRPPSGLPASTLPRPSD